jgi:hypothetical protein
LITARAGLTFLIDGQERPFDDRVFESCIINNLGYTMGYDEATRTASTMATITFLKRHLAP